MARSRVKKAEEPKKDPMDAALSKHVDTDIAEMPLNTYEDYLKYNEAARKMNKKLRECRYPAKPCPIELHPKQKIVFMRKDQPRNPLKCLLSTAMIDFNETLIPGQTYELPLDVIDWLSRKGTPIWDYIEKPANKAGQTKRETVQVGVDPRFALRHAI